MSSREVTIYHPLVILYGLGTSLSIIGGYSLYLRYFKRIKRAIDIPTQFFRKRYLYGKVTSVGDGDNFHFYHLPGGIFAGWGWLRKVPGINKFRELKGETMAVRICGADAPERAHFGKPAQPYGDEALHWLRQYILGRWIYVKPLHLDQYQRVVSKVMVLKWTGFKDVSEEMIKAGLATVYEAKAGAEFDGKEDIYRKQQYKAQKKKLGMWSLNKNNLLTPRQYKNKYNS